MPQFQMVLKLLATDFGANLTLSDAADHLINYTNFSFSEIDTDKDQHEHSHDDNTGGADLICISLKIVYFLDY